MTNRCRALRILFFPRGLISALVLMLAGLSSCEHKTAAGQPPLMDLTDESLADFKAQFNSASDETRMILLLSPT